MSSRLSLYSRPLPDSVEGLADDAKYSTDFLAVIKSFTESIIQIYKLVYRRIPRYKSRLKSVVISKIIKLMFVIFSMAFSMVVNSDDN